MPTDDEKRDFSALCEAIGYVTIHWALIEQQVDNWVAVVFHQCGGKSLRKNQDIPRSLSQKTTFIRDCLKKLAPLKLFANQGISVVGRIDNLSNKRHDLVHGAITSLSAEGGAFSFRMIGYEQEHHTLREFRFDLSDFSKLEKSLSGLLTEAIAFSQKLGDEFLKSPG